MFYPNIIIIWLLFFHKTTLLHYKKQRGSCQLFYFFLFTDDKTYDQQAECVILMQLPNLHVRLWRKAAFSTEKLGRLKPAATTEKYYCREMDSR